MAAPGAFCILVVQRQTLRVLDCTQCRVRAVIEQHTVIHAAMDLLERAREMSLEGVLGKFVQVNIAAAKTAHYSPHALGRTVGLFVCCHPRDACRNDYIEGGDGVAWVCSGLEESMVSQTGA